MRGRLVIKESAAQIANLILFAIADELNITMKKAGVGIERDVRDFVVRRITSSGTWRSILGEGGGKSLKAEFGLNREASRADDILRKWTQGIVVSAQPFRKVGNGLTGGLNIQIIDQSWEDVIHLPAASVITEKGATLPWLEWLLKFGNKIIVQKYDVKIVPGQGRSGFAVMVEGAGKRWSVPSEHSGTIGNNFVTRALEDIDKDIISVMQIHIENNL